MASRAHVAPPPRHPRSTTSTTSTRLVLVRFSIPIPIHIPICISFKRRCGAAATPCCCLLQNGVCGAPTKWRRRQRKLLFATHQINCKLFEQKLLQRGLSYTSTPSHTLPETAAKKTSSMSRCSCYVCCMRLLPPCQPTCCAHPPATVLLRSGAVLNLWQHLCVVSRAR